MYDVYTHSMWVTGRKRLQLSLKLVHEERALLSDGRPLALAWQLEGAIEGF